MIGWILEKFEKAGSMRGNGDTGQWGWRGFKVKQWGN